MATLKNTNIDDTGYLQLPSGTTAQRPVSPSAGYMRWNTTIKGVEIYNGDTWTSLITDKLPVQSNLVFHYDPSNIQSYSGAGTTITDLSANGIDGTLVNGVGYSSNLFTLDGTNDYIDLPEGFADFTSGFSFFAIANVGSANGWERIFDFGNGGPDNNILFARNSSTNNLSFEIYDGETTNGKITLTDGVLNNTLAFYGVTADGTNCKIFRNGVLQLTASYPYYPINITRTNNYIGRSNWAADAYFETSIGAVGMYDKAITDDEMNSIFDYYKEIYPI
jgi:hypothetical protein